MARHSSQAHTMASESFLSPPRERDSDRNVGPGGLWAAAGFGAHDAALDVHVHSRFEVAVVLTGEEERHYGSCVLTCGPGDIALCAVWEPHGWRIADPTTRNVVVKFAPEFLGQELLAGIPWLSLFYPQPAERPQVRSAEARARVLAIARAMAQEIVQARPQWESVVRLQLLLVLTELSRGWQYPLPSVSATSPGVVAALMPAMGLVHATPWRRVGAAQAAAACGMATSTFRAQFVRAMGINFREFSLRARLSLAAQRLLSTDKPIYAIAREAGFVDDSHFRRRFRKHYALGPTEYRREHTATR